MICLSECVHRHCGKGLGVHHLRRWRRGPLPGGAGGEATEKGGLLFMRFYGVKPPRPASALTCCGSALEVWTF